MSKSKAGIRLASLPASARSRSVELLPRSSRGRTMQRNKILLGLAGFLVLAIAVQAVEDRPLVEKKPAKEPATDQEFAVWAIACEIAEIKFAERALKQTKNERVKEFARHIREQ